MRTRQGVLSLPSRKAFGVVLTDGGEDVVEAPCALGGSLHGVMLLEGAQTGADHLTAGGVGYPRSPSSLQ